MINFYELEKKCKAKKIKKVLFFVGIVIGSVVFIGVAWYLFLWFTKKNHKLLIIIINL